MEREGGEIPSERRSGKDGVGFLKERGEFSLYFF